MPKPTLQDYLRTMDKSEEVVERGTIIPTDIEKQVDELAEDVFNIMAMGLGHSAEKLSVFIAEARADSGLTESLSQEELMERLSAKVQEKMDKTGEPGTPETSVETPVPTESSGGQYA